MTDYKKTVALAALNHISKGMVAGLGAGATIGHLARALVEDQELVKTLTIVSSSQDTVRLLGELGIPVADPGTLGSIDVYFDSCDQLDHQLNALKSGGGIHVTEKILASMADEFILLADAGKLVPELDATFPLVIEVIPAAMGSVIHSLRKRFNDVVIETRKNGEILKFSERNNLLIDVYFPVLPPLDTLNLLKMWPGVVDHSLFYRMASKGLIAGPDGVVTMVAGG